MPLAPALCTHTPRRGLPLFHPACMLTAGIPRPPAASNAGPTARLAMSIHPALPATDLPCPAWPHAHAHAFLAAVQQRNVAAGVPRAGHQHRLHVLRDECGLPVPGRALHHCGERGG